MNMRTRQRQERETLRQLATSTRYDGETISLDHFGNPALWVRKSAKSVAVLGRRGVLATFRVECRLAVEGVRA
jgi:hypothetical protein